MIHRMLILATALFGITGCDAPADSSGSTILRDSAGIWIAENLSDATGGQWQLQLPAVVTIGRSVGEEDGPDLFGRIMQVIRLSSGYIAVADALSREVRLFDENGSHLLTFGRHGEGPGEFTNLVAIGELAGDSIAAIDNLNARVSLFTSAGEFARSFPLPRLPGASAPNVVGWLEDGTLLVTTLSRSPSRDTRDQSTSFLYTVDRHGGIRNTLGEFPDSRLGRNGLPLGFGSRAEFAADGTLAWYGHSEGFELVGYDRMGSVRRIVRMDRSASEVTEADINEARAWAEESLQGQSGPAVERIRETEFASTYPVHGMLRSGWDGSLWVERYRSPLVRDSVPREWDIFDAEGRFAGHLVTPGAFRITDIGEQFVLGIHTDALGVQTARMYRLLRGAPATPDLTTTFDTINGVIHVTNVVTAPQWHLTQVVSIGPKSLTETGSPDEFGGVSSAALGPDEELYIADMVNSEVRVFGLDGNHRRTFGRAGEGPGEFTSLYSVAWVGDRLLTLDYNLGRITEFSAAGEPLGQRQTVGRYGGPPARLRFFHVGPDETYAITLVAGDDGLRQLYARHDGRGATGDTVPALASTLTRPSSIVCEYNEGWIWGTEIPFASAFVQHPGPGGVMYTAVTGDYRIAVVQGADTLRVIERTLPAEPIPDEEWEAGIQEFRDFIAETPGAECDPRRPTRPEAKPFIGDMFIAPDGKLWVEVVRAAGNRWELFDPEGRLLGSFPVVPRKERAAPAFGPDHLVTIRQDSLDLDHVDVWRIDRGW